MGNEKKLEVGKKYFIEAKYLNTGLHGWNFSVNETEIGGGFVNMMTDKTNDVFSEQQMRKRFGGVEGESFDCFISDYEFNCLQSSRYMDGSTSKYDGTQIATRTRLDNRPNKIIITIPKPTLQEKLKEIVAKDLSEDELHYAIKEVLKDE